MDNFFDELEDLLEKYSYKLVSVNKHRDRSHRLLTDLIGNISIASGAAIEEVELKAIKVDKKDI